MVLSRDESSVNKQDYDEKSTSDVTGTIFFRFSWCNHEYFTLNITSLSEQLKYLESISFNLLFNIIAFHD